MVNLYIEGVRCDLEGKETIATSYSIAPFSDIGKRTTNASINFKLPLTANNRAIFENNNVVVNASTLPYRFLSARLDVDGIDQKIRTAQLISIKDSIEIKLLGGNIDFFAAIKELKLSDLDLESLNHDWTLANAVASAANTSGYVYALIDTYTDSPNTFIDNVSNQIDVRGLLPSIFLYEIVSQIVTDAGFTASGDFLTNADYRSIIVPLLTKNNPQCKLKILTTASQPLGYTTSLGIRYDTIIYDESTVVDPLNIYELSTVDWEYAAFNPEVPTATTFRVLADGDYQFSLNFNYYIDRVTNNDLFVTIERRRAGVNTQLEFAFDIRFASGEYTLDFISSVFTLERDDEIFITANCTGNNVTMLAGTFLECIVQPETFVFGEYINLSLNLPQLKQSDILKALAQQFGLMYAVDNDNMIVYFRQFSEIVANKANAKDWSDKVDYSEKTEVNFGDTSYGQINHCEYAEDETVIKPTGTDYDILIGNKTLKPEYKLFELPYAASEQVLRMLDHSIAQIKIFTNYDTTDEEVNEVTPRVLIRRMQSFSPALDYTDGTTTTAVISVPLTHFILFGQTFNLGFEDNLLPTYSQDIIDVIQNFKLINLLLRINVVDINQLDFFIPVWIERKNEAGAYFYLSEIKQFKSTSKESSETELVLLP